MIGENLFPGAHRTGGLAAAVVAAAVTGASAMPIPRAELHPKVHLAPAIESSIASMSTGTDQPMVATGVTAEAQNAAIPLSKLRVTSPGRFGGIPMASRYHATAEKCLAQAIYYEAALEPELGQRAVAQVVLNRVRHPAYPNTVCGVVYEGANARVCQFSFTCDGSLLRTPSASHWARAMRLSREALEGRLVPEVGTATHYHADYVVPRWAHTLGKIAQLGRHIFYRFPGNAGNAASFYQGWGGAELIPQLDFARLRLKMAAQELPDENPAEALVPGTTVVRDVKDRHAEADVGGRLDTTKTWRLSIPDPTEASSGYRAALKGQDLSLNQSGAQ